jgi:hypothetical protein
MSDEELVKRLRPLSWSDIDARFGVPMDETMREAADRIEALLNLNEALVELMDDRDAKLAKAVEGLRGLMQHMPDYADTVWQNARETLAEIEGEKG